MIDSLVVLGSARQANELFASLRRAGATYTMCQVSEADEAGRARSGAAMLADLRDRLAEPATQVAGLSLGRGTVSQGIAATADCWSRYRARAGAGRHLLWLGPSFATATAFEDKLLAMRALSQAGIATVPWSTEPTDKRLAWPLAVKACGLTGGAGIYLADNEASARGRADQIRELGQAPLYTTLREGLELSVEALVLPDRVVHLANVFKEACDSRLVHADWKIKLALPVEAYAPAAKLLLSFVAAFPDVHGYVSIEGIVTGPGGQIEVLEVATRRTGNFALSDTVAGTGNSDLAIHALLTGASRGPAPTPGALSAVGVSLVPPAGRDDIAERLREHPHFVDLRVDPIADLPGAPSSAPSRLRTAFRSTSVGREETAFVTAVIGDDALLDRHHRLIASLSDLGVALVDDPAPSGAPTTIPNSPS
jgi:hypothetical protein